MMELQICEITGEAAEVCDCGEVHYCNICNGKIDGLVDDPWDITPLCLCEEE